MPKKKSPQGRIWVSDPPQECDVQRVLPRVIPVEVQPHGFQLCLEEEHANLNVAVAVGVISTELVS